MKELMPLETYNLGVTTSSKEIDRVFNYLTLVSTQENFCAKNWEGYHQLYAVWTYAIFMPQKIQSQKIIHKHWSITVANFF